MPVKIETLAIANRGEVAVRIIRACQEMSIQTVLLHSAADQNSLAARLADRCICVGGAAVRDSYLNIENNITGALAAGADAIHPGFGFLSENADFARACEARRLIFVGPTAATMELFGDKTNAKMLVTELGEPTLPAYTGEAQDASTLIAEMKRIGFPVMIKAAAGGGGRGMRLVMDEQQALEQLAASQREALNAFGSTKIFLEKYLAAARHIEVQVFGDGLGRVYIFGDRDCSIQRSHQKIVEEAPAPGLANGLRQRIHQTAQKLTESVSYRGAGTVEFLVTDSEFYFLEVNTRLQVEHPVTEMIYGIDLVKAQISLANQTFAGFANLEPRGHALECRVYAEDPWQGGQPSTGSIGHLEFPLGPGRRFDFGVEVGSEVTSHYDPMLGKVICWAENREECLRRLSTTLKNLVILGVHTNLAFLYEILAMEDFVTGMMTTQSISKSFPNMTLALPSRDEDFAEHIRERFGRVLPEFSHSSLPFGAESAQLISPSFKVNWVRDGGLRQLPVWLSSNEVWWWDQGITWQLDRDGFRRSADASAATRQSSNEVYAPMPGRIVEILVNVGAPVSEGQKVIVMEAMKMEYSLVAGANGHIEGVMCEKNSTVQRGQLLVKIK